MFSAARWQLFWSRWHASVHWAASHKTKRYARLSGNYTPLSSSKNSSQEVNERTRGLLLSIRPHRRTVSSSVFPSADRNCPHIHNNPSKFDLNQNAAHCKLNNSFWCRACCCHKVFPRKNIYIRLLSLLFPNCHILLSVSQNPLCSWVSFKHRRSLFLICYSQVS